VAAAAEATTKRLLGQFGTQGAPVPGADALFGPATGGGAPAIG
jgi:hypothetical protein